MQESQLYTGIPKWRERLGIEPSSPGIPGTTALKAAESTSHSIIPKSKYKTNQQFYLLFLAFWSV